MGSRKKRETREEELALLKRASERDLCGRVNHSERLPTKFVAYEKTRVRARAADLDLDERRAVAGLTPAKRGALTRALREETKSLFWSLVLEACAKKFEMRFGIAWRPQWGRWVVGVDSVPVAKSSGRSFSGRTRFIRLWEYRRPVQLPEARAESRFLSAHEFSWISILGGNRPLMSVTIRSKVSDAIAAELVTIKAAMRRHERKPIVTAEKGAVDEIRSAYSNRIAHLAVADEDKSIVLVTWRISRGKNAAR